MRLETKCFCANRTGGLSSGLSMPRRTEVELPLLRAGAGLPHGGEPDRRKRHEFRQLW